jgi:hypothetical protein
MLRNNKVIFNRQNQATNKKQVDKRSCIQQVNKLVINIIYNLYNSNKVLIFSQYKNNFEIME